MSKAAMIVGLVSGAAVGVALVACNQGAKQDAQAQRAGDDGALATLMFDACGRWFPDQPRPVLPGPAPLLDGLGDHHFPVTTTSAHAQQYFDQGLRLAYGFNHCEAERSFLEAGRRDPRCAMAFWGVAQSLGTNYNVPAAEVRNRSAYIAAQQALALAAAVTPKERALIEATAARFSDPPPSTAEEQLALDTAYAMRLKAAAEAFPDDVDVLTLYAESMMNLRPWALWTKDGRPAPGTLEIVSTLERAMELDERHPGANHLYIHAVEASPRPERAEAAADRLRTIAPAAGHLVHMPSHTYIRVGRYADAVDANMAAIEADRAYVKRAAPEGVYQALVTHNHEFLWACLMIEGRKAEALRIAKESEASLDPVMLSLLPGLDSSMVAVAMTHLRFADWENVLRQKLPPENQPYAFAMAHYARAVASARLGDLRAAEREMEFVHAGAEALKDAPKGALRFNPDGPILKVATLAGAAELALARGSTDEGLRLLREAVKAEDALDYSEPPDWPIPTRHRLGEALLTAGHAPEAEMVYREDLERSIGNGWALHGLRASLLAQGRERDAREVERRLETAWARADGAPDFRQ